MIILTKGLVLKKIKYGESSQILHVFTQDYGLQSLMIKGLGKGKRGNQMGNLLQPSTLLEFTLYFREDQNIKLIKDVQASIYFPQIGQSILKNSVAIFCMEVLHNLLLEGDLQTILFNFTIGFLKQLDTITTSQIGNLPIYFLIHAAQIMGYQISGRYQSQTPFLDVENGAFTAAQPDWTQETNPELLTLIDQLNHSKDIPDIAQIKMSHEFRQRALQQFLTFYEYHLPNFHSLKSVPILSKILS